MDSAALDDEWALLVNALADPIEQLIALEAADPAQLLEIQRRLPALAGTHYTPPRVLNLGRDHAPELLRWAQQTAADAQAEAPVLLTLVFDVWPESADAAHYRQLAELWRAMNQLRENWHDLPAQVLFLLSPAAYRHLTLNADHLKRWIALKIHLPAGALVLTESTIRAVLKPWWYAEDEPAKFNVEFLADVAGAAYLHQHGVNSANGEALAADATVLQSASRALGGHAFALQILALYWVQAHGGAACDLPMADLTTNRTAAGAADSPHAAADRMLTLYSAWLAERGVEGVRQLALLRVLSLFDRPADPACLAVLRQAPVIEGLTEALVDLSSADWDRLVADLQASGLIQTAPYTPVEVLGYGEEEARKRMETVARGHGPRLGTPSAYPISPLANGLSLDAHPVLRHCFAQRLQSSQPEAWRAAHRRLFEHLTASVPYWPEGAEGLQPLYQAMAHGCRAGLHQAALIAVYRDRILRRGEFYSQKKLGLFATDLSVLVCLFKSDWSHPVEDLSEDNRAWLLNESAHRLRALGRLREAWKPMRAGMDMAVTQKNWKNAATRANNQSELELTLGQTPEALHDAEVSIEYAERCGDTFFRIAFRTTLGDALNQAGQCDVAFTLFREAEALQAKWQPDYPLLYSLWGFRYCDALLAETERTAWQVLIALPESGITNRKVLAVCQAVAGRATQTLDWLTQANQDILTIALDHLTLARTALYTALLSDDVEQYTQARHHTEAALGNLHTAGVQEFIVRGLLTRAWVYALADRFKFAQPSPLPPLPAGEGNLHTAGVGHQAALADLNEAERIARRGEMRLHLADVCLHRARLFHDRAALAEARRLIDECGYERRRGELDDAETLFQAVSIAPNGV